MPSHTWRASSHRLAHTLAFYLGSHGGSFNSQIGISLTKEGEGESGGRYRWGVGKKSQPFIARELKLCHPSLSLPYTVFYLYVHSVPGKKKQQNDLLLIGQLSRLLAWLPVPSAGKSALPSLCFEMRKHLAGSPFRVGSLAQGSTVLCWFSSVSLISAIHLGEEPYLAKRDKN